MSRVTRYPSYRYNIHFFLSLCTRLQQTYLVIRFAECHLELVLDEEYFFFKRQIDEREKWQRLKRN